MKNGMLALVSIFVIFFLSLPANASQSNDSENQNSGYRQDYNKQLDYKGVKKIAAKRKAFQILLEAADKHEQWAMLLLAAKIEGSDKTRALNLYLDLAKKDHCLAQERLATAYYSGSEFAPKDLRKAYFWMLRANLDNEKRYLTDEKLHGEYFEIVKIKGWKPLKNRNFYNTACEYMLPFQYSIESKIPESIKESIQNIAGHDGNVQDPTAAIEKLPNPTKSISKETTKPKPKGEPKISEAREIPPRHASSRNLKKIKWSAAPIKKPLPLNENALTAEILFKLASKSIWMVLATNDGNSFSLGSAVAITSNLLLTNCHVVAEYSELAIRKADEIHSASIYSADVNSDKCILKIESGSLNEVSGFRLYKDLNVGEDIYAIGSPKGLELTLSKGIISGIRNDSERNLVQITAPISSGSSGGGIFDNKGNLIGISTFLIQDSQNLNFAISIDDFLK